MGNLVPISARFAVMWGQAASARPRVLRVSGDVGSTEIGKFCDMLTVPIDRGGEQVLIDLSGLCSWSRVAPAMVLRAACRLQTDGGQLVLVAPPSELVDRSTSLCVFGVIKTVTARRLSSDRPGSSWDVKVRGSRYGERGDHQLQTSPGVGERGGR